MSRNIFIIDYRMGNLFSVYKRLKRFSNNIKISEDYNEIKKADKIILPGVGHFGKAMQNIKNLKLTDTLNELAINKKIPVLGICLGMQIMTKFSEEGNITGLGWFDAKVVKFKHTNNSYKNPHIGWNNLIVTKKSLIFEGLPEHHEFYFVHSYHLKTNVESIISAETEYEYKFVSAIENGNIFGVQFHPEKSHEYGDLIFNNFLKI
ncbi:MAG TPA: imidazole glycerol phosphate synthase subunit HisH [Bacteroidales bacterium]|nr:imidazole glycerol phosphate synthase subunit HisH [Bacteroidales bacterium]HOL99066.1 imidazole glycerol phosphate synthase subunit HisH [Bacteroidales bacterium]HUM33538.1 imidazole glycerol phosphate synthase subunit HisH [Bacteroidales bacterium]